MLKIILIIQLPKNAKFMRSYSEHICAQDICTPPPHLIDFQDLERLGKVFIKTTREFYACAFYFRTNFNYLHLYPLFS